MADIRDLGGPGRAVFDTAQKLQKANLIDDAQFKELTNNKVGPQDLAISNKVLDKLQANTPDAMTLLTKDLPGLNKNILKLQMEALQKTRAELAEAQSAAKQQAVPKADSAKLDFAAIKDFLDKIGVSPKVFDDANRARTIETIRNIK